MTRINKFTIGMAFALTGTCFAAPPAILLSMEQPLTIGAAIFGLGLVGTAAWEIISLKKEADVSQLARAVESRSMLAAVDTIEESAPAINPLLAGRPSAPRSAPEAPSATGRPAPPPPPAARSSEAPPAPPSHSSAVYTPPPASFVAPPPPPPAAAAEVNPFTKMNSAEEDSVAKASNKPPIALSGTPEPPREPSTESGGWADLMQKVRSAKDNESGPLAPPSSPPPKIGQQGGAWEALLKKTTSSSESMPAAPSLPRPSFPAPPPSSGEGMPVPPPAPASNNPFSNMAPPPPPSEDDGAKPDNVPDFIRKASASRTISLDFGKGFDGKL